MTDVWPWLATAPIAYLLGSLPFGVIVGRITGGVDPRVVGSGSSGATNVARTIGTKAAALVLLLDVFKGASAIIIAKVTAESVPLEAVAGILVMVGHSWPLFAGFRGGKGVATGFGAFCVVTPLGAVVTLVGLGVAGATRYVSLGSIVGTLAGFIFFVIQVTLLGYGELSYLLFVAIGAGLILGRHRANVIRLLRGEENKFGRRASIKRAATGNR